MLYKTSLFKIAKFLFAGITFLFFSFFAAAQDIDTNVPMGWAVVSGYSIESTTGGGDGETVIVNTFEELESFASRIER